jgi:hypothetical protein
MRVRLYGIDAPEGQQICEDAAGKRYLCGSRASEALAALIGRNGRLVAICTANGRNINAELVRQGWAIEYRQYSDGRYTDEEAAACQAKRGLWAGEFVKPWLWGCGEQWPSQAAAGGEHPCPSKRPTAPSSSPQWSALARRSKPRRATRAAVACRSCAAASITGSRSTSQRAARMQPCNSCRPVSASTIR